MKRMKDVRTEGEGMFQGYARPNADMGEGGFSVVM